MAGCVTRRPSRRRVQTTGQPFPFGFWLRRRHHFTTPSRLPRRLVPPKRFGGGGSHAKAGPPPRSVQHSAKTMYFIIPAPQQGLFVRNSCPPKFQRRRMGLFTANQRKCLSMNNLYTKMSFPNQKPSNQIKPNQSTFFEPSCPSLPHDQTLGTKSPDLRPTAFCAFGAA